MKGPRAERAEELLEAARKLPPPERAAFLASQCPDDPGLREEVADLLRFVDETGRNDSFLRSPIRLANGSVSSPGLSSEVANLPGRIGPYTIVRKIGAGGMGVIYEARQSRPRRMVALKTIRPGLISPGLRQRFELEAEVLGRLRHAGIAQIYEAGVAETIGGDGNTNEQLFFAMEYVEGQPLDRHCAGPGIDLRARLRLFVAICEAVHHAHECGVVHRDLKPENILVSPDGRPKILDFGVARVLDDGDGRLTMGTATGQILGTLPYMSPEQVSGHNRGIDPRSDVYALGVLLYEALAGRLPYEIRGLRLADAARTICEDEPTRLGSLRSELRGDIDTIVGRALEKEPARRYASAAELGSDLDRYLRDEPIAARPPSAFYQLRKFARRNRALVGGVAATLATLLIGIAVATTLALRASRENASLQWMAYRMAIRGAEEALATEDRPLARQLLAAEPLRASLRGWEWRHLWSQAEEEGLRIPSPQPGSASSPLIHADGEVLEYWIDGQGYRFNTLTGEQLASWSLGLRNVPDPRISIVHAPDGRHFAVPTGEGADARVHLLDRDRGACATAPGTAVDFGPPRSNLAAVIDASLTSWIVDLRACEVRYHLPVVFTSYLSQGNLLGWQIGPDTPAADQALVLDDLATGRELARHPVDHAPRSVVLTTQQDRLAAGGYDGNVRLLDVASGATLRSIDAHQGRVISLAFNPDDSRLASAGSDGWLRIWDVASGRRLASHRLDTLVQGLQLLADGRLVAVRRDGSVTLLVPDSNDDLWILHGHDNYVYALAYDPRGESFATADFGGGIRLWDRRSGRALGDLRGPQKYIHALHFSADGSRLLAVSRRLMDGRKRSQVAVWDVRRRSLLARRELPPDDSLAGVGQPLDEGATRVAVGWEPRERRLAVWDVATDVVSDEPLPRRLPPARLWVSGDGRFAAKDRPDSGALEIMNLSTGAMHTLPPAGAYMVLAFSHGRDGPVRVVAPLRWSSDAEEGGETLGVWEAESGRLLGELRGHTREVLTVAFSPDDRRIVTGSRDAGIRVWDSRTLDQVARLEGHTFYIKDLAFSPDGEQLISASGDRTVRVWDTVPNSERLVAMRQAAVEVVRK